MKKIKLAVLFLALSYSCRTIHLPDGGILTCCGDEISEICT